MFEFRDTIFPMQIIPPPRKSFLPVLVAVPRGCDPNEFTEHAKSTLGQLNTQGDQRIKRIQLVCLPEPSANDEAFFCRGLDRVLKYSNEKNLIPRSLLYFLSTKAFANNSKIIDEIATVASVPETMVLVLRNTETDEREAFASYAPPPYIVVSDSSADSEITELSQARRIKSANEAYWRGIAHARSEMKPELLLPWVQRVIDIEAERHSAA